MKKLFATALCLAVVSAPALAQEDKPIMDRDPDAMDVAKTPVTDLNLDKKEIPEVLLEAERQPYSLKNLSKCSQIVGAVRELNDILGPDIDLPQAERDKLNEGRLGKALVGMLIPFRGLIREVSGANDQEKRWQAAIDSGLARRGFLKGVGQTKGCAYPARPASREMVMAELAERKAKQEAREKEKNSDKKDKKSSKDGPRMVSQPVVQSTK